MTANKDDLMGNMLGRLSATLRESTIENMKLQAEVDALREAVRVADKLVETYKTDANRYQKLRALYIAKNPMSEEKYDFYTDETINRENGK